MEAFFVYILKASAVILVFYVVYELLLKKETLFLTNRIFLLTGLVLAALLPLIVIQREVEVETAAGILVDNANSLNTATVIRDNSLLNWEEIFMIVFTVGFVFMLGRLCLQLLSVLRQIRKHKVSRLEAYKIVEMKTGASPFSFFHYIFYNPAEYGPEELNAILEHEKVHCRQWHSLDILLGQFTTAVLWFNPLSWIYLKVIRQNLEFLADARATQKVSSRKNYQYTMLKISGNLRTIPLTNHFYNSLIKKRIVMLHQSKSKKRNIWKTMVVLPFLALFLWSFNVETVYLPVNDNFTEAEAIQKIDIRIDKDTSNKELEDIKKDLSEEGIDFSYTVVHNKKKEIIDLSVSVSSLKNGKNTFKGTSTFNNDGNPIDPVTIVFDKDNNFFFTTSDGKHQKIVHTDTHVSTWMHSDEGEHESIEIYKDNGKEIIKVNGKEVSRKQLEKLEKEGKIKGKHFRIEKHQSKGKDTNISITTNGHSEHEVKVISDDDGGFYIMQGDLDDSWLILLNGKEVDQSFIEDLDAEDVESITVLKGEKAVKKYGKKDKENVLEITTKE